MRLEDDELIYCLKYALEHIVPVTKAFSATALCFGKDEKWCKKVIRYEPVRGQVERVMMELKAAKHPSLILIKKHNQFNEKQLFKFKEWRGLINHLKDALKLAQLIEGKELEITRLKNLLAQREVANHDLQAVRKSSLLSSQTESIQALRKEFPEVSVTEIAQAKDISRNTVYNHLKSDCGSSGDDLRKAS